MNDPEDVADFALSRIGISKEWNKQFLSHDAPRPLTILKSASFPNPKIQSFWISRTRVLESGAAGAKAAAKAKAKAGAKAAPKAAPKAAAGAAYVVWGSTRPFSWQVPTLGRCEP